MLPSIVRAVAGRCEVYLDGGVRLGTDVHKALALGARAVFVGRPVVYSLAYNVSKVGALGARAVGVGRMKRSGLLWVREAFVGRPTVQSLLKK